MGSNAYIRHVAGYGYKTESAATAITHNIPARSGERVSVRAFAFTCGGTACNAYFMTPLGQSTISSAIASGATTGFAAAAEPQTSSNALASSDYIAIQKSNGEWYFGVVATGTYTGFSVSTAAASPGAISAGAIIYGFGVAADTGHYSVLLTVSVQTARNIEGGGLLYGSGKNEPMIVYHENDAAAAGSIDYVTVDYINK